MKTLDFTYWQDGSEYPDYLTEGTSFEDLKEHLADLYQDLSSGAIPFVRRRAKLALAGSAAI